MAGYVVKTEAFEGPIEFLLCLIEEKKLHISRVALAEVTDSFLNYLKQLGDQDNRGLVANFILVAATLMLIKSVSLLPTLQLTQEEQGSIEELEQRLRLYRRIKELSRQIKERFGRQIIFLPVEGSRIKPVFSPTPQLTRNYLVAALRQLIQGFPLTENLPRVVVNQVLRLEEVIADLTRRIKETLRLSFRELIQGKKERIQIILSFLGMLELVKQGVIRVEQKDHFQDITFCYNDGVYESGEPA